MNLWIVIKASCPKSEKLSCRVWHFGFETSRLHDFSIFHSIGFGFEKVWYQKSLRFGLSIHFQHWHQHDDNDQVWPCWQGLRQVWSASPLPLLYWLLPRLQSNCTLDFLLLGYWGRKSYVVQMILFRQRMSTRNPRHRLQAKGEYFGRWERKEIRGQQEMVFNASSRTG